MIATERLQKSLERAEAEARAERARKYAVKHDLGAVPVLAESQTVKSRKADSGEARESTSHDPDRARYGTDSRGGAQFVCEVCEERKRKKAVRMARWRARKRG
jgi:hypothetical protein